MKFFVFVFYFGLVIMHSTECLHAGQELFGYETVKINNNSVKVKKEGETTMKTSEKIVSIKIQTKNKTENSLMNHRY